MFLTLPAFCCESRPALGYKPPVLESLAFPDSKTARREQRSLLLPLALSFWIHPDHAPCPSRCQALLWVQTMTGVTARGLGSPLLAPSFIPTSPIWILWCQLKMKLEQPAFPQVLPRAGLPWDEALALSLDILRSYL